MKILRNQKGQSLVEFSIILPLLLLIIMGIVEFGMMLNSYLTLNNAARDGARYGVIGNSNAQIQSMITSSSPSLNSADLTITITPADGSRISGNTLTVNLTYNYKLTVPIISGLLGNSVQLKAQTTMRIE